MEGGREGEGEGEGKKRFFVVRMNLSLTELSHLLKKKEGGKEERKRAYLKDKCHFCTANKCVCEKLGCISVTRG